MQIRCELRKFTSNNVSIQKLEYMGKFLDECLRMWTPAVGVLLRTAK